MVIDYSAPATLSYLALQQLLLEEAQRTEVIDCQRYI